MKKISRLISIIMCMAIVMTVFAIAPAGTAAAASTTVKLSATKLTVAVGEARTISLKNADDTVKWSSSDKTIATVKSGKITGIKKGTVTITAKYNSKSYTCKVTVQKYRMTGSSKMQVGASQVIKVKGKTSGKTITWSTSDKSVATVTSKGKVKALKAGKVKITAKVGGTKISKTITISGSFDLNTASCELGIGEMIELECKNAPAGTVKWTTSNASVAKPSQNGVVTALGEGTATITATVGGQKATCVITVAEHELPMPEHSYPELRTDITIDDFTSGLKKGDKIDTVTKVKDFDIGNTTTKNYSEGSMTVTDSKKTDDDYTVLVRTYDYTYGLGYIAEFEVSYYIDKTNGLEAVELIFSEGTVKNYNNYNDYLISNYITDTIYTWSVYDMMNNDKNWNCTTGLTTYSANLTCLQEVAIYKNNDQTAEYVRMSDLLSDTPTRLEAIYVSF